MLFETQNQFFVALIFIWLGILVASISEFLLFKTKNKILNYFIDFCFWCFAIFLFYIFVTLFNLASVRLFCILSFFVGFLLVKIFWHNLIAKIKFLFYNRIGNIFSSLKKKLLLKIKNRVKTTKKKKKSPLNKRRQSNDSKKIKITS